MYPRSGEHPAADEPVPGDEIQDLLAPWLKLKDTFPIREFPEPASRVLLTGMSGQVLGAVDHSAWSRGDDWLEVALLPGPVIGWIERVAVRPFESHGSRWAVTLRHMLTEAGQAMLLRRSHSEAATFSARDHGRTYCHLPKRDTE
jgi:hypothetical protein